MEEIGDLALSARDVVVLQFGSRRLRARSTRLSQQEIRHAFSDGAAAEVPVILSPHQLADLLGLSVRTVYEWIAKGRLDGAFRKRGKHILIWRDKVIDVIFNGKEWDCEEL